MELLSQLDVQKPDHVSVITRDNRVTISVTKDGSSVSIGFPLNGQVFDLTPRLPLQQTTTEMKAVKVSTKRKLHRNWLNNAKLNEVKVREIKEMLSDEGLMKNFSGNTEAYHAIGKAYGVSYHSISNIHKGKAWKDVTI